MPHCDTLVFGKENFLFPWLWNESFTRVWGSDGSGGRGQGLKSYWEYRD